MHSIMNKMGSATTAVEPDGQMHVIDDMVIIVYVD